VWALLFLALAVVGTTVLGSSSTTNYVWAEVFEGTDGPDTIVGTPEDDLIDSKGGGDVNFGDSQFGDGSGNDIIASGGGNDQNRGDTQFLDGSGNDVIASGEGDDSNYGDTLGGDGSGNDVIASGEGNDGNVGDTAAEGEGSGDDIIASGEEDDTNTGNGGRDIFTCGNGEDTVTDFNEAEGDIATPDCENV
jgi:Ca2+-binding RTX toxin-like protein